MFQNFTDSARKVMALANQEAQRFGHEYIGTQHILLGLLKQDSGIGANVLKNLDVDIKKLRLEIEKLTKSGIDEGVSGKLPQTPRAKKVIGYAIEEARSLNHNYVGTEHILLGLLRDTEGIASQVLMNLGLKLKDVQQEVLNLLGTGVTEHMDELTKSETAIPERISSSSEIVSFKMLIDPGQATSEELGELFAKLSILYRMMGGSGLEFRAIDVREGVVSYV